MSRPSLALLPPVEERPVEQLENDLLQVIADAIRNRPRSKQAKLGPSEIGSPCLRRLAHKLAGTEPVNVGEPAWRPQVGVAVHDWLAGVFAARNRADGKPRWLVEFKVEAGMIGPEMLDGNCDLYDRATHTVVDWKIVGATTLKNAKHHGPDAQYRVQANTYGLGWRNRDLDVRHVAVMYLPSAGELSQAVMWRDEFRPQLAEEYIVRANGVDKLVRALGVKAPPMLPTAEAYCNHCPFFMPGVTVLEQACPGHPKERASA